MKRGILTVILFCFIVSCAACADDNGNTLDEATSEFFAMNTYISVTVYGKDADNTVKSARDRITELERLWSVTDENSEIYAVNHSDGKMITVSEDTAELIAFALRMAERTNGALEPTIYPVLRAWGFTTGENRVPQESEIKELLNMAGYDKVRQNGNEIQILNNMMLDLGAVGKGYAGDEIAELLKENGITSALIDLGGNIQLLGTKPDGSNWRIGLKDPEGAGNVGILSVSDCAIVTSGNYERYFTASDGTVYGHIIDPVTGYPVNNDLLSVTVIAKEGKICDALSTSLFVMGVQKAEAHWRQYQDFDMILITKSGEIHITEGIKDNFSLDVNHGNMKVGVIEV